MSEFMQRLMRESRERAARLEASNPSHQSKVELADGSYRMATCDFGHQRIKVLFPDECAECGGSDDYGGPFCPICEFCCGC